jgi:hypothetical protein
VIRKAAADLNRKITLYQEKYPHKGMIEILSFVALNVSMTNVILQKQIDVMTGEEEGLAKELQAYLDNMDKNSR